MTVLIAFSLKSQLVGFSCLKSKHKCQIYELRYDLLTFPCLEMLFQMCEIEPLLFKIRFLFIAISATQSTTEPNQDVVFIIIVIT